MLFNSLEYLLFLPIVFAVYWAIGYARINDSLKLRLQITFEWSYRNSDQAPIPHRWWIYYILIAAIWWYAPSFSTDFIYFQF